MIALIGIPIIALICYKTATLMPLEDTAESKCGFAQTMLGSITLQNVLFVVLIACDLIMDSGTVFALLAVAESFICIGIEIVFVKKMLMGDVSLFETKEEFHERLQRK